VVPVTKCKSTTSARDIFQLVIWRTFAFGDRNHITQLKFRDQTSPDLILLANTINAWDGNTKIALARVRQFSTNQIQDSYHTPTSVGALADTRCRSHNLSPGIEKPMLKIRTSRKGTVENGREEDVGK
jgi:hypothetical protein